MSVEDFPDWKRIGNKIGKKLKGIIDPPKPGPSPEERLAQRLQEALKGLVYFDIFSEVREWNAKDVDSIQQANTPLLERAATQVYNQTKPNAKILLCHDYSGALLCVSQCHAETES